MITRHGEKGGSPFSQPTQVLMDCHRRIERFLGVLREVAGRCSGGKLRAADRRSLETAIGYFKQAIRRHVTDEEQSLFPRLRQSSDRALRELMPELDRLETGHRKTEAAHRRIDALGRQWIEHGHLDERGISRLLSLLEELSADYSGHIRLEDERVFPAAALALEADDLRAVGEEMERRRLEDPGREGSRCATRRKRLKKNRNPPNPK